MENAIQKNDEQGSDRTLEGGSGGEDAINPECVLLTIKMPFMECVDLYKRIRQAGQVITLITVTTGAIAELVSTVMDGDPYKILYAAPEEVDGEDIVLDLGRLQGGLMLIVDESIRTIDSSPAITALRRYARVQSHSIEGVLSAATNGTGNVFSVV